MPHAPPATCFHPRARRRPWPLLPCWQVVERRTPLGAVLSAPLVSMLVALVAAAAGLLPTASGAADAVWAYLMPLGAACYLLESDLTQ